MGIGSVLRGLDAAQAERVKRLLSVLEQKSYNGVTKEFLDDGRTKLIFNYGRTADSAVMLAPDGRVTWAVFRADPPSNLLTAMNHSRLSQFVDHAADDLAQTVGIPTSKVRGHIGQQSTPHAVFEDVDPDTLASFATNFDSRVQAQWADEMAGVGVLDIDSMLANLAQKMDEYPEMFYDIDADFSAYLNEPPNLPALTNAAQATSSGSSRAPLLGLVALVALAGGAYVLTQSGGS